MRIPSSLLAPLMLGSLLLPVVAAPNEVETVRFGSGRRVSFNNDWRFLKGDAPEAERAAFDDSAWRPLRLPHDWAIEGPFDRTINPHEGSLPYFGTAWYRKHFTVQAAAAQKQRRISIEFDGAMSNSTVWINGHRLGGRPYGYIGFTFDLTPYLNTPGQENVIAVRLEPERESSRWYPGAGLYRNVWLDQTGPQHVAHWGTRLTTPRVDATAATVEVQISVENQAAEAAAAVVETALYGPTGIPVASTRSNVALPAGGSALAAQTLQVPHPRLWTLEDPALYRAVTVIRVQGKATDRYETPFGIRTVVFDHARGVLLNGKALRFQGVCLHHDLGALGTAVNTRAIERQLQIMKSMGVNAIRTSHNPPAPELLDLCDRMGLLVMDEAFDMWKIAKVKNGYSKFFDEWSDRDARDFIQRDRNHPSVVMWSIGNEIPEQDHSDGWKIAQHLTELFHHADPTRPTTAAFNSSWNAIKNELADHVDFPGFNYKPMQYEEILAKHPKWTILGTETASCLSSRGVYHLPVENYDKHPSLQLSSYDIIAPDWAYPPDVEFEYQDKLPQVLGEFVWTGFDYIGEPTPYFWGKTSSPADWPSRSSYFGTVDLAGFPKDRYFLYQSRWTSKPMVHVLPHWNWAGREGQPIPVMVYTNADEVELFLNEKSLGKKKRFSEPVTIPVGKNVSTDGKFISKYRLQWQVPYAAGEVKAVAWRAGVKVAEDSVHTAGTAARLVLTPDRNRIAANGDDLSFITVRVEDAEGHLVPDASHLVRFKIDGPASIAAVDNGNPATVEPFQADYRKAFNGLCLLVVRSARDKAGAVRISAESDGLKGAEAQLTTVAAPVVAAKASVAKP